MTSELGYLFAELAGVERGALADEFGLEPVADGFVQQDPAPARREHDGLWPGGGVDGAELRHRHARGFAGRSLGGERLHVVLEGHAPAAAVKPLAALAVSVVGDGGEAQAAHHLVVFDERALGGGDDNLLGEVDEASRICVTRASMP